MTSRELREIRARDREDPFFYRAKDNAYCREDRHKLLAYIDELLAAEKQARKLDLPPSAPPAISECGCEICASLTLIVGPNG